MTPSKEYKVTLIIQCRPQMMDVMMDELASTVDYENGTVLTLGYDEVKKTYR